MDVAELEARYRTFTEDELLELAIDSDQLSPEAKIILHSELSKRGVSQQQIESYRTERKREREAEITLNVEKVPTIFPSLRGIYETLKDWKEYRRETGNWPFFTIAFSFLHLAGDLGFLACFIWLSIRYGWSMGVFLLVILPLLLIDVLVANWVARKIRYFEIRRYRRSQS